MTCVPSKCAAITITYYFEEIEEILDAICKKETLFLGILPYKCVTIIFKCLVYQQLKKVETKKNLQRAKVKMNTILCFRFTKSIVFSSRSHKTFFLR